MHNTAVERDDPDDDDVTDDVVRHHVFSDNIRISECGRHVDVVDRSDVNILKNLIQYTRHPLSLERRFFTISLKSIPEKGAFVMFGINARCFIRNQMWAVDNSLRYHSNDGGIFNGGAGQKTDHPFTKGDEITCYVDLLGQERSLCLFLKNGRLIFRQWINLPQNLLYATVGFKGSPISIEALWPGMQTQDIGVEQSDLSQWLGFQWIGYEAADKSLSLCDYDSQQREAFCKTAPWPLTKKNDYFEIQIESLRDQNMMPVLGLRHAGVEKFRLPGWDLNTIGYHGDMGGIFHGSGETCAYKDENMRCQVGDRQGCGLLFPSDVDEAMTRSEMDTVVYFTKNGNVIYHTPIRVPHGGFYPSIGFCVKGEKIKVDMETKAPKFSERDIQKLKKRSENLTTVRHHPAMFCTQTSGGKSATISNVQIKDNEAKMLTCQYLQTELDENNRYFSAKILNLGLEESTLIVGVASPVFPLENAGLGKDKISSGYESRGGFVITSGVTSKVGTYTTGDVIGVYLEHLSASKSSAIILFSKNGRAVGRTRMVLPGANARPDDYEAEEYKPEAAKNKRLLASVVLQKGPLAVEVTWPGSKVKSPQYHMSDVSTWVMSKDISPKTREVLRCQPETSEETTASSYWQIAQSCQPFSKDGHSYIEISCQSSSSALPIIGVSRYQPLRNVQMGSREDSGVGFSGHIPAITHQGETKRCPREQVCTVSCRMGVGVWFRETADGNGRADQKVIVYVTRNGDCLMHELSWQPKGGYYPTISFHKEECEVKVNVPVQPPPMPHTLIQQWASELEGGRRPVETDDGQIYQQLVSDVINYTDFIIPKQEQSWSGVDTRDRHQTLDRYKVPEADDEERTNRKTVYISHVHSDKVKACMILDGLSKAGFVVEMSLWLTSDSTVLQSNTSDVDYIVVCLSDEYCTEDQISTEMECLKRMNSPIIPVIVRPMTTWPPEGNISDYRHTFINGDKYRLQFLGDEIDTDRIIQMIDCIRTETDPSSKTSNTKHKSKSCCIL